MVTMVDVSKRAGVSTATVSRVLNNPDIVDEKTRKAVNEVIAQLGYRPNIVARDLASRSSRTVGVVINRFSAAYYGRMLDGVEAALAPLNFKTIAESSRETIDGERSALESLMSRQCDAIVLHSDLLSDEELSNLMVRNPNLVLMNRLVRGYEQQCVYLDNVRGGEIAAQYLVEKGHRDIAIVTGPKTFYEVADREEGFRAHFNGLGLDAEDCLTLESDFTYRGGHDAMKRVLDSGRSLSAVFFHNDEMAAGGLEYCRENNVSVPGDISVLGFDDVDIARYIFPKLTTIRQPLNPIGVAAGTLAHARAMGMPTFELKKVFEAEVVERSSVSPIT